MRISRRFAAILALAAAGAVAVAGIAMAAADGNHSTVEMTFSPSKVPKKTYKSGSVKVHTHTDYANPGNIAMGGNVKRAQIYFDDDIKFNTSAAPTCKQNLGNIDMAAAMAACGKSKIGKGTAHAQPNVPVCVLAFNGPKHGKKPSVILFSRIGTSTCGNPKNNHTGGGSINLTGVLKKAHGDFGKVLDVNPVYPLATLPLDDFVTTIKKGKYVQARCHDHNKTWNMKAKFTYTDNQSDTAHAKQKCKVKH
jgi:hypothetical protein